MQQLTRALALAFAAVIAHVSTVLPHPTHAAPARPAPAAAPSDRLELDAQRLKLEEIRVKLAAAVVPVPPAAPARPSPTASSAAPVRYSGSIQALIQQAFAPFGSGAVSWAERVAMCESGDNPNARNASGAAGLFQIMPGTWAGTPYASQSPFNPVANARAAEWLYARRGASAWSCG